MPRRARVAAIPLATGALLLALAPAPARAAPGLAGTVFTGRPAVAASVGDIMREERSHPSLRTLTDQEQELTQPDRSHLPQAPGAPAVASLPGLPAGAKLPQGEAAPFGVETVGVNWTAATLAGVNPTLSFPPDCMGAVGPTQFVVFVNGRLVTFDKSTGTADGVLNADPDIFFAPVINGSSTSDPRIRYDRLSGRWILVIINVSTPNRILIAVSDAASAGVISPGTVFSFYFIDIANTPPIISSTCLADYPTLGVDANALYVGTNNFCGTPQSFSSTDGFVVRKSSVLSGGPIVVTAFRGLVPSLSSAGPYTPQGVDNLDPASNEGYFIGVDNLNFGLLQMVRIADPGGTPSRSATIPITVAATQFPVLVPHLGNTGGNRGRLAPLDDRLFAAHLRNGRLWTAHNIGVDNTGVAVASPNRCGSRWYELSVPPGSGTPTIVQAGTVFSSALPNDATQRNLWIPSVMVSGQGHAAMGMSTAGTSERANCAVTGRFAGDAPGTMAAPTLYTASATAYNPPGDPGTNSGGRRWGDYSYTMVDPLDDMTMYTVQMFCDATNSYGVRVARLIAPPPATPATLADVPAGQTSVSVTLSATSSAGAGFFDPGADLPGVPAFHHLSAAITTGGASGTPPSVVSATYVDPTTVNLVLDASAATPSVGSERYTLTVTNPDGQAAGAAIVHVTGTTPVATLTAGPSQAEGNAGDAPMAFTVTLSSPATSPVRIHYQTLDGTATAADNDYVPATGAVDIAIGASAATIPVAIVGDTKHEPDETFTLQLLDAAGATLGAPSTATGTILNDDAEPTVSIAGTAGPEGNAGTSVFTFPVTLSSPSASTVTVNFQTMDGTATVADNDYVAQSGQVAFPPGTTLQPIPVPVNGDATVEPDESFQVLLSGPVGGSLGASVGVGVIVNDDALPALSLADVALPEGNAGVTPFPFQVTLTAPSSTPVQVDWHTADGTATAASGDYAAASGTLVIPAQTVTAPLPVTVFGDSCGEADETFTLHLVNPVGATLGIAQATGTIQNDDDAAPPTVAVTYPNAGQSLVVGSAIDLQWTAADNVGVTGVDLFLSRDGGASYPDTVATGLPNTGAYPWTVTDPATAPGGAFLRVVAHDGGCNVAADSSDVGFTIVDEAVAVEGSGPVTEYAMGAPRPNPTTGTCAVQFQLPRAGRARLSVIDLAGREVATLLHKDLSPGRYVATWNGRGARERTPAGVYFLRFEAGGKRFVRRLVLVR